MGWDGDEEEFEACHHYNDKMHSDDLRVEEIMVLSVGMQRNCDGEVAGGDIHRLSSLISTVSDGLVEYYNVNDF